MKKLLAAVTFILAFSSITIWGQSTSYKLNLNISVSDSIVNSFKTDGRLIIYFTTDKRAEPRYLEGTLYDSFVFATNIPNWNRNNIIQTDTIRNWMKTCSWDFSSVPSGTYYIQALWKQNRLEIHLKKGCASNQSRRHRDKPVILKIRQLLLRQRHAVTN